MSSSHRCVFVGNIPYDATEEQLIQICEEVGPVVSFRLVLDRETGKPKGYGFCEFRDEETAASARRNLQSYEINGRPLRVDFAENEKGGSAEKPQGRGGPGLSSNSAGSLEQPIGFSAAAAAASAMAGAIGNSQSPLQNDALTNHLASMSKQQLYDIMSQMRSLIQQNQQQARQILVSNPPLTKALFQAQIMLGMVHLPQQPGPSLAQSSAHFAPPAPPPGNLYSQSNMLPQAQARPTLAAAPTPPPPMPPLAPVAAFQQPPPLQHQAQFSMSMPYQQPPLAPQPLPPHSYQLNRGGGFQGGPPPPFGVSAMDTGMPYNQIQMPPPPPPQQQQPPPQMSLELEQQKKLLEQVMKLTPEQISSLPPEQRQQVIQLQNALR